MAYNGYPQTTLAQVPNSHAELRSRLEAAGIPPEQIMQVMTEPNSQQHINYTVPPHPTYVAPQQYSNNMAHPPPNYMAPPPTHYLAPPPPNYMGSPSPGHLAPPSTYGRQQEESRESKMIYKMYRETKTKRSFTTSDSLSIVIDGMPSSSPVWTIDFKSATRMSQAPDFRFFRHKAFDPSPSARHQIYESVYHRHNDNYSIETKDNKNSPVFVWEPEIHRCRFDTGLGTLGPDTDFDWVCRSDPHCPDSKMVKCHPVIKGAPHGDNDLAHAICCAAMTDENGTGEVGEIQLSQEVLHGATEAQMDDVVSTAMCLVYRYVMGWKRPPPRPRSTGTSSNNSAVAAIAAVNSANAGMC